MVFYLAQFNTLFKVSCCVTWVIFSLPLVLQKSTFLLLPPILTAAHMLHKVLYVIILTLQPVSLTVVI